MCVTPLLPETVNDVVVFGCFIERNDAVKYLMVRAISACRAAKRAELG